MKTLFLSLLIAATAHAANPKAILLVLTNHAELGDTGKRTGFFLSEAAHPYEVFTENGNPVTLASPKGGFAPLDPKSLDLKDEANAAFWKKFGNGNEKKPGVEKTVALSEVDPKAYSAIFFAGGHGAMWDFPDSESLKKVTASIYENNGSVGAVCHGPAALINVKLSDGSHLISGKKTAVFTNSEEKAVNLTDTVPFLLQSTFEKAGATVETAKDFSENAVRDGRLVTGQNPTSAKKAAELLLEALEKGE
jgi:putative intracellular protease/amidase